MQKSAHPIHPSQPAPTERSEPRERSADKGQKFEPFFIPVTGRDADSLARLRRLDQRR
jgi:hypothetical protein